jgi:hypothetical protein
MRRWEVGALDDVEQPALLLGGGHRLVRLRGFDRPDDGVHHLAQVVGGTLVAMPTAMPAEPLTSRLGNGDGRTDGSSVVSS